MKSIFLLQIVPVSTTKDLIALGQYQVADSLHDVYVGYIRGEWEKVLDHIDLL